MGQLLAAIDRPLPLRQRPDLVAVPQWFRGQRWVVVQDPLAVTHFYLTEAEHALLAMLDGRASIAEIRERYERRFAPQKLDAARFHQFLVQLHKNSLVVGDLPGQGEQLALRRKTKEAGPLRWLEKLLAIRFRGIHPQGLLAWLDPRCGWIFGRMGLAIWLVVVAAALLLTIARVGELPARWAGIAAFSAPENLLWLGLALAMVKTLHELGHALAARRCGCPVREMGLQLFFLLPCLYTNVSEVSLVPSKWRRMAVSAAGIYVELFLAAVAMLLWWFAEPGPLASLCAGIMLVASIGTLVLNGNPLMRYDGYYLLADWAEMPNLEQRSRTQLLAWLARWGLGYDWHPGDSLDEGRRSLLALFAAAALAYRGAVMVGVYFGVRVWLAPWGLAPLADLLAAASIVGLVAPLAAGLGQILMQARSQNQIRPGRVALSGFVLALLVAAAIWIPLPQRVVAPAVLQPRDPSAVYVTTAGTLLSAVESGAFVKKGDVLARLENLDLRRDLARLQAQHREQEVRLIQLETTRDSDPTAAAAIPATQETLADLAARIEQVEQLIGRLTLVAPADGIVLAPPRDDSPPSSIHLSHWTGTPLDRENLGCLLETGTLLCEVALPGELEAVAVVEQTGVPLLQPGAGVRLIIGGVPGGKVAGVVADVARLQADRAPLHLVAAGLVHNRQTNAGAIGPLPTTYEVRIALSDPPSSLVNGEIGWVSIAAPAEPLVTRLARWLGRNFRFGIGD